MKDITFIGGGPAGYVGAIRAAQLGADVCIVEADELGGTCLNRGCIPTKALYRNAEVIELIKKSEEFGINAELLEINLETIQKRKEDVVETLVRGIQHLLKKNKVEVIYGNGILLDPHTIKVLRNDGEVDEVKSKNIILATGSKPFLPPIPGCTREVVKTTEEMLAIDSVPSRVIIVGGGVIGMEFACILNSFGSEVTVVEMMNNILPTVDSGISKRLKVMLKKRGIKVMTGTTVKNIEDDVDVKVITVEDKKGEHELIAEEVLVSTGRVPNVDKLGLDELGIEYHGKGIKVKGNYTTNIDNIFAIGDVNGESMLAHAASYQAVKVVEHLIEDKEVEPSPVPGCIFTSPEIATVGITEDEAKKEGLGYITNQFNFSANGKALTLGEGEGFVKVIADKESHEILGVHIMGPHASDLINEGILAVEKGLKAEDFTTVIHPHPTLGEAFHEAILGLIGEAIHQV